MRDWIKDICDVCSARGPVSQSKIDLLDNKGRFSYISIPVLLRKIDCFEAIRSPQSVSNHWRSGKLKLFSILLSLQVVTQPHQKLLYSICFSGMFLIGFIQAQNIGEN
jgi:hypothetical protein